MDMMLGQLCSWAGGNAESRLDTAQVHVYMAVQL